MPHLQTTIHLAKDMTVKSQNYNDCGGFVVVEVDALKIFIMRGSEDVAIRLGTALLAGAFRLQERADAEG